MSVLLRNPQVVPSLFSRGGENDDATGSARHSLLAACLGLIPPADFSKAEAVLGRGGGVFAGSSIGALLIGLPVLKAASLVAALALAR